MSKLDEMGATDEALGDIHALAISLEVARQSELAMILAAAHEKIQTSLIALIERVESQQQVIDGYARDWHSLSSAAKEKQQEIDRLKAENEKLRELVWLADKGRCMKCEWPLESSPDKGCVPGNCSYRPHDGTVEHAKCAERNALVAKVREALGELRKKGE